MTILSVKPISSEGGLSDEWHREWVSVYEVVTDDAEHSPSAMILAPGIPAYRSSYAWFGGFDTEAFCNSIKATIRNWNESRLVWRVVCNFTTKPFKRKEPRANPLDDPPELSGSFVEGSRIVYKDKDDAFLRNSAGEQFIGGVEEAWSHDTLNYVVNTATINLALRASFNNRLNDDTLWGLPARCIWIRQWAWDIEYFGENTPYIRNAMAFAIRPANDPWDVNVLDEGSYCHRKDDEGNKILNAAGAQQEFPFTANDLRIPRFLLDGQGCKGNPNDPEELPFKILKEASFSSLPIVNPLPGPFV